MDIRSVRKLILRAKGDRSIRALASDWHVDHAHLYRMMQGERPPSDEVLYKLGLEQVTCYRKRKYKSTC